MPKLTQTLGPWCDLGNGKLGSQLSKYYKLSEELVAGLPQFASFHQNFSPQIYSWLPWQWAGFSQSTRYTYVIEGLTDHETIFKNLDSKTRNTIRKAKKVLSVHSDSSLDNFWLLNSQVFTRQGLPTPYSYDLVQAIDEACQKRNQRKLFFAADSSGVLHAAVYLIWDENSAYYLMGGSNPDLRSSGAMSLTMWHAIKFAGTVTKRFDFEGSMIKPIERFVRGFGAEPMAFHSISRTDSRLLKTYQHARGLIGR